MHTQLAEQTKKAVEEYLEATVSRRRNDARAIHDSYETLWMHIGEIIRVGGKRIRPYLTMVGYGEFNAAVVPVAAAQELIHTAMLAHDDVIDQDMTRRGADNINGIYDKRYKKYLPDSTRLHYAYSASILAGDALISEAYRSIALAELDDDVKTAASDQLYVSIYEVIGGELIDVEAGFMTDVMHDPMTVYRYKTAGYSFIHPLAAGALCARADQATIENLKKYGELVGIGFQLQDDILGVFGDEVAVGKSLLIDLRDGKATYLAASHKKRMNDEQAKRFASIFGKSTATKEELLALKTDFEASGARRDAQMLTQTYFDRAMETLSMLQSDTQRNELMQFTEMLRGRKA